jgi:hypothetical protein
MDLWSPGGLHLESVGEGKLHSESGMDPNSTNKNHFYLNYHYSEN